MAVSLEEFNFSTRSFLADFNEEWGKIMLKAGISAKTLIQDRFQQTGQNAEGSQFGEYTPFSTVLRSAKGLQVAFVDLTDRGDMWRDIGIVSKQIGGNVAIVTIGPKNSDALKKLGDNIIRFDTPVLVLNKEEEDLLAVAVDANLQQLLNRYF